MKQDECYELGAIVKTHGLKGEVLAMLDVDEPESYAEMDSVFVEIKGKLVPFFIKSINVKQNRAIIKFEDIHTLEEAHTLIHSKLFLPLDVLPEPEEGKFYLHEVLDYQVIDQTKGKLGIVSNVFEGAHQDLIAMLYEGKEVLIPIVDEILLEVNREAKEIIVNLPEGLLELYLSEDNAQKSEEE
jgi:16S rRNA processing protein RimM